MNYWSVIGVVAPLESNGGHRADGRRHHTSSPVLAEGVKAWMAVRNTAHPFGKLRANGGEVSCVPVPFLLSGSKHVRIKALY